MMSTELQTKNTFKNHKQHLRFEMQLKNIHGDFVLLVNITNQETQQEFLLKINQFDIRKNKQLAEIFRNCQDIYEEIVGEFQSLQLVEEDNIVTVNLEVKLGKFRTQNIQLKAKKHRKSMSPNTNSQNYQSQNIQKIRISQNYTRDFTLFKQQISKVCTKLYDHEGKQLEVNQGLKRYEIKNMLIGISNELLRSYKTNIEVGQNQNQQHFHQYQKQSKLLQQRTDLFHKTYEKAVKSLRNVAVQDIDIDFDCDYPRNLTVVKKDGTKLPIDQYLPEPEDQQFKEKVEFYENSLKKLRQIKARSNDLSEYQLKKVEAQKGKNQLKQKLKATIPRQNANSNQFDYP